MFFNVWQALTVFTACLLGRAFVYSIRKCGLEYCRDDHICCAQGNATVTCCKPFVDETYYNIAMVTRKLSGVLILLLLFAVGYFVQRMLCSSSRQSIPPQNGPPTIRPTASQELLMESCSRDSLADGAPPLPQRSLTPNSSLPTYDDCKRLPTYEETVLDGKRGLSSAGPRTSDGQSET